MIIYLLSLFPCVWLVGLRFCIPDEMVNSPNHTFSCLTLSSTFSSADVLHARIQEFSSGGGGGPGQSDKKSSDNVFLLLLFFFFFYLFIYFF